MNLVYGRLVSFLFFDPTQYSEGYLAFKKHNLIITDNGICDILIYQDYFRIRHCLLITVYCLLMTDAVCE